MGGIVFAWHDEWFKTSWNTMDFDDNDARPKWLNVESSEENFGLVHFSAFPSVQIDGSDADWASAQPLSASPALKAQWDESYLYLRVATENFQKQVYYLPIDTIQNEGNAAYQGVSFSRNADFLLVLDGQEHTRLLVDPYYNPNYKLYGRELFSEAELQAFATDGSGSFIDTMQVLSNKMRLPQTGQVIPIQLWNTGLLRYGNSNPDSPAYDSLADFCAGDGFVELRIPWMLLNFADPSSGKILDSLHNEGSFAFQSIQNLYVGLGMPNDTAAVPMAAYALPSWGAFPYTQRLKQSYAALQKVFPQYATYPIQLGQPFSAALRLRDTRLLYVRIDRQIRRTDLIMFLLIGAILLTAYLFILLLAINMRLNHVQKQQEREERSLRLLLPLPAEEIRKRLHRRYLRSAKGADLLCRFLTDKATQPSCAMLEEVLRAGDYPIWMLRSLRSRDIMLRILIVRLAGLLRIRSFEAQIIPLMQTHQDNLNLQYAGLLALSMMGNRDSIVRLCSEPNFTKALSYRSLKEIFTVYAGDKRFLYEKLLDSNDGYIRRIVIKNIGEEGLTGFADRLTRLLNIDDRNLLCDVIRTLGQLRYAPAGEQIARSLQSGDWVLRNAAVVALASIDADVYRPYLLAGLQDREWWVRYNSARELCTHVPLQALDALLPTLHDRFATDILRFTIQETRLMGKGVAQA